MEVELIKAHDSFDGCHIWHLLFMPVSGRFSFKILWFSTIVLDN